MVKTVNIISFDNPYPADYGGAIDVFFKIKSLHKSGVKIILHAFTYGNRLEKSELQKYCSEVYFYPRKKKLSDFLFSKLPFIVKSRDNKALLANLALNDAAILFEGLHSCYYLNHPSLRNRKKLVRLHNVEWKYYSALAKNEINFFKRIFFNSESRKLKAFESRLDESEHLLAISKLEENYYHKKFSQTAYIPAFHQFEKMNEVKIKEEPFALYFGNLSVSENEKAALYLADKVFNTSIKTPLIIAGKSPTSKLRAHIKKYANIKLIENPSSLELQKQIESAKMVLLPTFQNTGLKLKLLNALYNARHIVVNDAMLPLSDLKQTVELANSVQAWQEKVEELSHRNFTDDMLTIRKNLCAQYFDTAVSVTKLLELI